IRQTADLEQKTRADKRAEAEADALKRAQERLEAEKRAETAARERVDAEKLAADRATAVTAVEREVAAASQRARIEARRAGKKDAHGRDSHDAANAVASQRPGALRRSVWRVGIAAAVAALAVGLGAGIWMGDYGTASTTNAAAADPRPRAPLGEARLLMDHSVERIGARSGARERAAAPASVPAVQPMRPNSPPQATQIP